jgi:uncharacterized RDD family membrane protein YckC
MSKIRIETTQNVFIEFGLAGLGERILAFVLDAFFLFLYIWAMIAIFADTKVISYFHIGSWAYVLIFVFFIFPITFYSLVQEMFFNGQTLGKRILNIKVVTTRGKQPSPTQYIVRWSFRLLDIWSSFGILGIVMAATNKYHQRLGDLAADTCLIKLKSKTELSKQLMIPELHEMYVPKYTQVTLLSDTDINLIKEAIMTFRKYQNDSVLQAFATKIKEILRIDTTDKDEKFLDRIVKDYTYLTSKED